MGETSLLMPEEGTLAGQFEDLRRRATKDALSGLLNRATMEQYIKDRLRAMAPGETCALFIVDLDDFKQVNDTLGHLAGDQAIRQTAQILSRLFRASDIVGRLGGDEFLVYIKGVFPRSVLETRLKKLLSDLRSIPDASLTSSIGLTYVQNDQTPYTEHLRQADIALYHSKRNGKDCYCFYEDLPTKSGREPAL